MPDGLVVFRFGAFEFDPDSRGLSRADRRATLSAPQAAVLAHLLSQPAAVIPKDTLTNAGWPGLAVAENSLQQVIHRLRTILGADAIYIETVPSLGYRFAGPVERAVRDVSAGSVDARLEPFLTFVQGRTRLETLDRDGIREARHALDAALREAPGFARGHVLLAMACGLAYEASATDSRRDTAALHAGITHARAESPFAPTMAISMT